MQLENRTKEIEDCKRQLRAFKPKMVAKEIFMLERNCHN